MNKCIGSIINIFVLIMFLSLSAITIAPVMGDTRLDTGTGISWSPSISNDGNGNVYVIWSGFQDGEYSIFFNYSSDYGINWLPSDVKLNIGAGNSWSPQISSDGSGNIYVTWSDLQDGVYNIYFNYSSDHGINWQQNDVKLNTGTGDSWYPQISSDDSGNVYVTWLDYRNGNSNIYFNYTSDYGANWQTGDIRLDTGTGGSWVPTISSNGNGYVYVVWPESRDGGDNLYLNYSNDYGANWQTSDIMLDIGTGDSWYPQISSDGSGNVYVAWEDYRNGSGDIYFNYSSDYGANWLIEDIRLDTGDIPGENDSWSPQISDNGSGTVYVIWEDDRDGSGDIYFNYSSDYGINWQTDHMRMDDGDTPGASSSWYPQISSDNSGNVYGAWEDYRNGYANVYFNSYTVMVDSDNDGISDNEDLCPGFDDGLDADTDDIPDGCDICSDFDDNVDVDVDGIPDGCDALIDSDSDGVADVEDQCPGFDDNIDVDVDGIPDGCDTSIDTGNDVKIMTICHKPGTSAEHTLVLPEFALFGHLKHGDTEGACGEDLDDDYSSDGSNDDEEDNDGSGSDDDDDVDDEDDDNNFENSGNGNNGNGKNWNGNGKK